MLAEYDSTENYLRETCGDIFMHTHKQIEMHILTTLPVLALYYCQPSAPLFQTAM
ncbi:hypothetical protein Q5P01_018043 [Channa striata]|uniref:Uncharacterized protein n=1 Tax=Channa striata TaxID=64152 RepID=A0AA88M6H3_CHASR|nr:hypothetical protein Q5P01_018043 [Channa striata]